MATPASADGELLRRKPVHGATPQKGPGIGGTDLLKERVGGRAANRRFMESLLKGQSDAQIPSLHSQMTAFLPPRQKAGLLSGESELEEAPDSGVRTSQGCTEAPH